MRIEKTLMGFAATALVVCAALIVLVLCNAPITPTRAAPLQMSLPVCDKSVPVSSASSLAIITPGANNFVYICGYNFGSIGGSTFSIVEGTGGATCPTNTLAVAGGTTAAAGFGLAANGVINWGSGSGMVLKTAVAGDNVCLIVAGTGPLAGAVTWTSANF